MPEEGERNPGPRSRTAHLPELDQARSAVERFAWKEARQAFSEADKVLRLGPADLDLYARAAYLAGNDLESIDLWTRSHHAWLHEDDIVGAARSAFWLTFAMRDRGERARAAGWATRGQRMLEDAEIDSVESGYLLLPIAFQCLGRGDIVDALATFSRAAEYAKRFRDPDLEALARHSRGRLLIRTGRIEDGVALLDEAMAAVDAGDLSPIVVGVVFCSVIEGCLEIFDVRRAQEWTLALSRWCESQPGLVAYRGECQVRRSEIFNFHGDWDEALEAANAACEILAADSPKAVTGSAFYQRAEICRLRGEFDDADDLYRAAAKWGRKPQPGLALLRLGQGHASVAESSMRRALDESGDRINRCRLLPAYVEIMLANMHVSEARTAANELMELALTLDAPVLHMEACYCDGRVLLKEGNLSAGLATLRTALRYSEEIRSPYRSARIRTEIGAACRALGDVEAGSLEFEAAEEIFLELGARGDLQSLRNARMEPTTSVTVTLTPRQEEVLAHIAAGKTNREIANDLYISEKTVARHVSNILARLDLPNRAAAAAFAQRVGLSGVD